MRITRALLYSICILMLYYEYTASITLRKTGRECTEDKECILNAYCHENKMCLCKDRFIYVIINKTTYNCVNEASSIGDVCVYDAQCTTAFGTHAQCKKYIHQHESVPGKCACKSDSHYQDGICYKNSRIGEACQVNDNCVIATPNLVAYCEQSRCSCPPYYHANNDGTDCLPSSDLDGPCKSDEDCITMNSRCLNVCGCKMGYVMNEEKTHCLLAASKLHDPCDQDKQCSEFLPNTWCDREGKRCNCSLNSHELNGACFKTVNLLEPCTKTQECIIESKNISRVECVQGFCICSKNYKMINRSDCIDDPQIISVNRADDGFLKNNLPLLIIIILMNKLI